MKCDVVIHTFSVCMNHRHTRVVWSLLLILCSCGVSLHLRTFSSVKNQTDLFLWTFWGKESKTLQFHLLMIKNFGPHMMTFSSAPCLLYCSVRHHLFTESVSTSRINVLTRTDENYIYRFYFKTWMETKVMMILKYGGKSFSISTEHAGCL